MISRESNLKNSPLISNFFKILALVLVLSFFSCKQEKKEEEPSQMEQVMKVHDEIMPKMGTLSKLVAQLKSKIDTTEAGKRYEGSMKELQAANESMMDWMMGFGDRFDSEEILNGKELSAEKKQWLDEEEEKVLALKEQVNQSIEKAEALLKE